MIKRGKKERKKRVDSVESYRGCAGEWGAGEGGGVGGGQDKKNTTRNTSFAQYSLLTNLSRSSLKSMGLVVLKQRH
jgi:hypothetical protein